VTYPVRGQSPHASEHPPAGHAPSDALRREPVAFRRDRTAVHELARALARHGESVARPPRASEPVGSVAGTRQRRVLRERAARG
jgi:hypothetical protein